jgi:hypothetical protein
MSEATLKQDGGKWVATYGRTQKTFETMKEAAQWLDDCAEAERQKTSQGN